MTTRKDEWKPWEDEFLAEVYPLRDWCIAGIAEKLERSHGAIRKRANYLGIKRPRALDYDEIALLTKQGFKPKDIAYQLGYSIPGVRLALSTMKAEAA